MKNKHGILSVLLALALLLGNALILPRLLAYAQGLPDGEVVTQQPAAGGERVPLPKLPEGFGEPYKLAFSRPLSEGEQQIWDALLAEMGGDYDTWSGYPGTDLTYTQRVYDDLIEFWRTVYNASAFERYQEKTKIGGGAPGTILIDYGTATVCVGDDPLTRETALPLVRMIAPVSGVSRDDVCMSELDVAFEDVYWQFNWMEPQKNAYYSTTRSLTGNEFLNQSRLKTEYLLSGLRPGTPLAISETPDGKLWMDEQNTIHLPMQYELTDDEMLNYIELVDSLTRRAVLHEVPDMITQQQAEQLARDWAKKLFDMDTGELFVFTGLYDDDFFGGSNGQPVWRVKIGPEDMLICQQRAGDTFDGYEIILNVRDGTLDSASRFHHNGNVGVRMDRTIQEVKSDLEKKAVGITMTLFEGGKKPEKTVINTYSFVEAKNSCNEDVDMMHEISYVVSMPDGVDHELNFTTYDYALTYYRYWPDGCRNMG